MSNASGFVQQDNIQRASDGSSKGFRITRDGALIEIPWLQALCLEGRVFGTQQGSASLTITAGGQFGPGAPALDEFDYINTIPATVAILPVFVQVAFTIIGTVDETGLICAAGGAGVINAGITLTPFNMRPGSSNTTSCVVEAIGNTGGTNTVLTQVFHHDVTVAITGVAGTPQQFVPPFSVTTAGFVPVLEGATSPGSQFLVFAPNQAGTGYITTNWVELPIAAVN